jgi:hypothetical protein
MGFDSFDGNPATTITTYWPATATVYVDGTTTTTVHKYTFATVHFDSTTTTSTTICVSSGP